MSYRIFSKNGCFQGVFKGKSKSEAVAEMYRKAGYKVGICGEEIIYSLDAYNVVYTKAENWIIEEVA